MKTTVVGGLDGRNRLISDGKVYPLCRFAAVCLCIVRLNMQDESPNSGSDYVGK